MFVVKCPKCGKRSKAFVDHAGRRGECPHCRAKIRIVAEEGQAPTGELAPITALPAWRARPAARQAKLPHTTPPSAAMALLAIAATWLLFRYGDRWFGGTALQPAWELLLRCMWIGKVEVFMFVWGVLMLCCKGLLCYGQSRPLRWQVLPSHFSGERRIGPGDVDHCLGHLQSLSRRPRRSLLLNRVWLALEHLRQTGSVQEVRGALTGQSAIDANLLDSSYGMMRFLIWVVPILGFIGTVTGIGLAVSRFADFIPQVSEIEQAMDSLRSGLGEVTTGLGAAFNTTLVALVLVAPLMLATSWLRTVEERLLAEIDQFTNHNLLAGLAEDSEPREA